MYANQRKYWRSCLAGLVASVALAQSPVTLKVDLKATGAAIPADFLGLSFEASNLLPEKDGGYILAADNKP